MISKDELIKNVAQNCGVAPEISSFFFEVFVNRLSAKLKAGDIIHFFDVGYFHKRNCRIQLEKSPNSPTGKSYLIQLILLSSELKIRNDLNSILFLKIPNLKTLWEDDPDFEKSLKAGDFSPYIDRNQLIKSFATKAEVIISGLRKDYDSELLEELIIPLTFDLNFLIKTGQKNIPVSNKEPSIIPKTLVSNTTEELKKSKTEKETKSVTTSKSEKEDTERSTEESLPWNYGTKFLEKNKVLKSDEVDDNNLDYKKRSSTISDKESNIPRDKKPRLSDFEPVPSHLAPQNEDINSVEDSETIKYSFGRANEDGAEKSATKKFTEVKSKTEAYNLNKDTGKTKKKDKKDLLSDRSKDNSFFERFQSSKRFLQLVVILIFVVVAGILAYNLLKTEDVIKSGSDKIIFSIKPDPNVNVIERDYEFAVTYPYPKSESRVKISGYNRDMLLVAEVKPDIKSVVKDENKKEIVSEPKDQNISKTEEKPKIEVEVVTPPETKADTQPIVKEEKGNRIFLHKNFYVVYIGTFKSEEIANSEADRYFNMGYNAFVEEVETRSRKKEYKLNVGDFTSEEFAREFQEKYLK